MSSSVGGTPQRSSKKSKGKSRRVEDEEEDDEGRAQVTSTPSRPGGRRVVDSEDDEEQQERRGGGSDIENVPASSASAVQSASRRKKRRVDPEATNDEGGEDELQDDDDEAGTAAASQIKPKREVEDKKAATKPKKGLIRDPKDGYVMGSIVRITCHNFVTYFDIECTPGAHLNMICGPNGSGKSSLAAAIAIGLGFPAKVMGRAKDLRSYVREGCEEGFVEIELKGRPGRRNTVIKRELVNSSNATKYYLNGQQATQKEVQEAVADLNISVDNLCAFLPQDKVTAFSQKTPAELLRETQQVVNPKLLDQQEQLGEYKAQLDKSSADMEKNRAELTDKERKLNSLKRDVERHLEKVQLEKELTILNFLHPFAMYIELKDKAEDAKRQRGLAKERLDAINDNNAPMIAQKESLKALSDYADQRRKLISKKRTDTTREKLSLEKKLSGQDQEIDNIRNSIHELRSAEEARVREMRETEKAIQNITKMLSDEEPPSPDDPELQTRMQETNRQIREALLKIEEIAAKHEEINNNLNRITEEKHRVKQQLAALDDVQKRKEASCAREDPNLWTGTQWLREHRREFKEQVFDPIRLLIGPKDKRNAKVAEAAVNYQSMKSVVCFNREDYNRIADTFTDFLGNRSDNSKPKRDLRLNVVELPPDKRTLAAYPKPISQEQLHYYGFDCFAIDLIEGPEPILAYLCETQNLHQVPVALDDGQRIRHQDLLRPDSPFRRYISKSHVTTITISRYGNRKAIAQDAQTRDARLFAETVDTARKQELELKIAEIDSQREALQSQRNEGVAADTRAREEIAPVQAEKNAIRQERSRRIELVKEREKARGSLRTKQDRLHQLKNKPSEETKRLQYANKMNKLTLDKLKIAKKLQIVADQLIKCLTAETSIALAGLQATANHARISEAIQEANEELQAATTEYREAKEAYTVVFASAKEMYKKASDGQSRIPDEIRDEFHQRLESRDDGTPDAIADKIEELNGQLGLIPNVSQAQVDRYEATTVNVQNLRRELENQEATVQRSKHAVDRLHAKWYPEIQRIADVVGRNFAKHMSDMGCLGEVRIDEHEDYMKWAIKIRVAFRDKEEVSDLDPHRQSGGERSLSTMLYLISLLETSKVPFSLVDEINQGMDQRAERAVHNQLVHAVCEREDVGQYFLITPKLLTNLDYHEKVKVLCVNNGDWLPEKLPLGALIGRKLKAKTRN